MSERKRFSGWLVGSLVTVFIVTVMLVGTASSARAHCCTELGNIRLLPVDRTATPRLSGTATVLDCFGVISMLDVVVKGPGLEGAAFAPAIPGFQPLLGDFFYVTRHRGEGFILDVGLSQVQGQRVVVYDQDFNEVLSGTFP